MELVCPAGNLPSLKAAVDNGADAVYFGLRNDTNARHFPGLNFNAQRAAEGIAYARPRGVRVFMAINTYPKPDGWQRWQAAVDNAGELGVDALICADMGVLQYEPALARAAPAPLRAGLLHQLRGIAVLSGPLWDPPGRAAQGTFAEPGETGD